MQILFKQILGSLYRGAGSAACTGFDKASDYCDKNGVYDKLKIAKDATVDKMKQINDEYHVTDKAMAAGSQLAGAASRVVGAGVAMGLSQMSKQSSSSETRKWLGYL